MTGHTWTTGVNDYDGSTFYQIFAIGIYKTVLFIIQLLLAVFVIRKNGGRLGSISRRLILFNVTLELFSALSIFIYILGNHFHIVVLYYGSLAFLEQVLVWFSLINYIYLMRFRRVQVQLNSKKEETNEIIAKIVQSNIR